MYIFSQEFNYLLYLYILLLNCGLFSQVIITLPDSHFNFSEINVGFALSLFSAIFYALNIVTLRSWVDHEDKLDITLYFGNIFIKLFILFIFYYFILFRSCWSI